MENKRLILSIIFIIALIPRLYNLDSRSAWMDESKQAALSDVQPLDFTLARRAAGQQQPPLDYFFESIGLRNVGNNETGMRIHAAILGALAALFFYLLLQRFIRRQWVVLTGTALFIFHPYLLLYSQEGRPIASAVFFSVLLLNILTLFFQNRQNRSKPLPLYQWVILLTVVQTGFLLSAGFQPLVFMVTVSVCLIPYVFSRQNRNLVYLAWLSTALAFFAALPVIKLTIDTGARYNFVNHDSIFRMIANLLKGIGQLTINDIFYFYRTALGDYGFLFIAAAVIGIAGYFLGRGAKANPSSLTYGPGFFLLFFIVYPPVYSIIFKSLISWDLWPRYFLSFVPVVLVVLVWLIDISLETASGLAGKSWWQKLKPAAIILAVLLLGYTVYFTGVSVAGVYGEQKTQWNKMYHLFKYRSQPGDVAYMMNLVAKGEYSPDFRAKSLYYPASQPRPVILKHARNLSGDIKQMIKTNHRPTVYLVTRYGTEKIDKAFFKNIKNVTVFQFHDLTVTRIRDGGTENTAVYKTVVSVLQTLKEKLPQDKSNYTIRRILSTLKKSTKR